MQGKIIKGIAGFYYVHDKHSRVYECKAKGAFRNRQIKPLVGDDVEFEIIDEVQGKGNITEVLPRSQELIRPAVSNIDQAAIIVAAAGPAPNPGLLDRFLIWMEWQDIPSVICINKIDLDPEERWKDFCSIYEEAGYKVCVFSVKEEKGLEDFRALLQNRTTVLAGASGVGKSSLLNLLKEEAAMETGSISGKIQRGRHTTRHSEMFFLEENSFILDTPGFTSLNIPDMEAGDLREYFPEFREFQGECRFQDCVHIGERDCAVKAAAAEGRIALPRYESYKLLYEELKNKKKY